MSSPLPSRRPTRPSPNRGLLDPGRPAVVNRVRKILERRETPRLEMAILALLTGAAGFLASWGLLRLGVRSMPWRYTFAMLLAYGVFFLLLRYWLHLHGKRLESSGDIDFGDLLVELPAGGPSGPSGGGEFGGAGASASFGDGAAAEPPAVDLAAADGGGDLVGVGDVGDLGDADEATIPLVVVGALLLVVFSSLWVVWAAPALLAELLVDCALVGGLYRRLKRQEDRVWELTALRKTILPFAATTGVFALTGWLLQSAVPTAHTLSEAMRIIQSR